MKQILTVAKLDQVGISVDASSIEKRDLLLVEARDIQTVTDAFTQGSAVDCLRDLNGTVKSVEKARTEIKAPVLDLGRKIDALAKEFCEPITKEVARLNKLVTDYTVAEQRKAAEAERLRQAELQRIAQEAEAARQAAARAEAARLAAEQEKHEAFTRADAKQAEDARRAAEAERLRQEAAARLAEAERAKLAAQPAVRPADKPSGLSLREVWRFEVTDAKAVYAARPDLCSVEVRASGVQAALRDGMRECPGLCIWKETTSSVRS